nr:hypothetical protein [Pirellula staleyi]
MIITPLLLVRALAPPGAGGGPKRSSSAADSRTGRASCTGAACVVGIARVVGAGSAGNTPVRAAAERGVSGAGPRGRVRSITKSPRIPASAVASGVPARTQRHWHSTPGGKRVKKVENETSQRRWEGRSDCASTISGKGSSPSGTIRWTGRPAPGVSAPPVSALEASTAPQPGSPVNSPQR